MMRLIDSSPLRFSVQGQPTVHNQRRTNALKLASYRSADDKVVDVILAVVKFG